METEVARKALLIGDMLLERCTIICRCFLTGQVVKSPLVGTFYTAPSEDADPFVQVGDQVKSGQTLAIVEAMKLMNEIESEYTGEIKEVLVENGQMVEYGQPLFRIG